jgi:hypothetical protein
MKKILPFLLTIPFLVPSAALAGGRSSHSEAGHHHKHAVHHKAKAKAKAKKHTVRAAAPAAGGGSSSAPATVAPASSPAPGISGAASPAGPAPAVTPSVEPGPATPAVEPSSREDSAFTEPGITGTTADFANCPKESVIGEHGKCTHSYTTGGQVQIGHSTVPITVPGDTLDVGLTEEEEVTPLCLPFGFTECVVSPPHGILNGPAQPVPGGLLGVIGNVQVTGVSAKLEWATSVTRDTPFGLLTPCGTNPLPTFDLCKLLNARSGTAVTLSVKIHLMSPFLGSSCYIGSAANPIVIPLTAGVTSPPPPAKPIHGKAYELMLKQSGAIQLIGVTLVSNSFSVPVATGCGTSGGGLVDASIDHKLGLPSAAGQNMMVIDATGEELEVKEIVEAGGWTGE